MTDRIEMIKTTVVKPSTQSISDINTMIETTTDDKLTYLKRQLERQKVLLDEDEFLEQMILVKKNTRLRIWLYVMLFKLANTLYDDIYEEGRFINLIEDNVCNRPNAFTKAEKVHIKNLFLGFGVCDFR